MNTFYDAWKEGGILCNATHGLTSFVGSGGAPDAALASYTTSVLSPVLNKQNNPLINFMAGPVTGALLGGGNPGAIAAGANTDWNNRQLHPQEMDLIRKNAKTFAIQQNISEEQATSILTGETLRGVSDDYADLQENHAARAFLNQLPGAGKRTADGQHLFGVLDRNSDEYRNSLYNIRHVDSNADLYAHLPQINKAFDDGGDYILWRAVGENKDNYNKAEKKDVLEVYEAIEKRVNTYQEKAENLLGSKSTEEALQAAMPQNKASILRNSALANYTQGRNHFRVEELFNRDAAYGRVFTDSLVGGLGSISLTSANAAVNETSFGKKPSKPITSQGKADMVDGEALKHRLRLTEAANDLVDSLRATGKLPNNYITKHQARQNGWKPKKALDSTNKGKQLGGDIFQNNPPINGLPVSKGRVWYEADIGISNKMSRSNQAGTRLLYSNDGLLYVTGDHYQTIFYIGKWK